MLQLICPRYGASEHISWKPHVAIIGSGKDPNMYQFNEDNCNVFCINHAINTYKRTEKTYLAMVEGHLSHMMPVLPKNNLKVLMIYRKAVKKLRLADGSTLTLLLSYLVKEMNHIVKKIYLQGFSFDGDPKKYNWSRQVKGVQASIDVINERKLDTRIYLTTPSVRLTHFEVVVPDYEDMII